MTPPGQPCRKSRREFLWEAGGGFASVALAGLFGNRWLRAQLLDAAPTDPVPGRGRARRRLSPEDPTAGGKGSRRRRK